MNQNTQWQPSDIMNAEAGSEPESPKKRGRIPQSAWPQILERYRSGATLSAIAREFSCTPSAISYIVRKAEAAGMEVTPLEAAAEEDDESAAPAEVVTEPESKEEVAVALQPAAPPPSPPTRPILQPVYRDRTPERLVPPPVAAPVSPPPAPPSAPAASAPDLNSAPRPAGRPEPTPPVDEVEGRLRDTARGCLVAYRAWKQVPGETSIQALADAVHELRKALARIEIDMSASRREEQAIRPIPIPSHRAARRPQ